jgi:ribokinase
MFGVDLFTPNQHEAQALLGVQPRARIQRKRAIEPKQMAGELMARGAKAVALKLGGKGSVYVGRSGEFATAKPFKIKVVDATAAGDAFTGALAVARAEMMPARDALRFANAAGAICCQGFGAQPALPSRAAVNRLVRGS